MSVIELAPGTSEVEARSGDHLLVRLPEQGGTGYVWVADELPPGAAVVADAVEVEGELTPGGTQSRVLEIEIGGSGGRLALSRRRPWEEVEPLETMVTEVVVRAGD